jgi:formylglycine-generating enzyme required for sulfatase activity
VTVAGFWIDRPEVTNAQIARFRPAGAPDFAWLA